MGYTSYEFEFDELIDEEPNYKKILIEGDSWVSHPQVDNLAQQFRKIGRGSYNILNIASPGDTALNILDHHGAQYKKLKKLIASPRGSYKFDMIFLSAAGNDIVGPEVRYYVDDKTDNPGRHGRDLLNGFYDIVIKQIKKDYEKFLKMRDDSQLNSTTPVLSHAYSYLKARPVGTQVFGHMFNKGWLSVYLDDKGIRDQDEKNDVVAGMLDKFHQGLASINANNFMVVNTLDLLSDNDGPKVELFHDEIHPTSKGFKIVAKEIRTKARAVGLWPD